jgi:hypothetical protein
MKRKELKNMIVENKEKNWKEFCATLDIDPWGRPYRATISKIARKVSIDGLYVNKIQKKVGELFQMRPTEQIREANDGLNGENSVKSSRQSINSNELISSRRKSHTC